jgi:hypothetical protein
LLRRYRERYEASPYINGPYRDMIRERIADIRDRYGLASSPPRRMPDEVPEIQPSLFETA